MQRSRARELRLPRYERENGAQPVATAQRGQSSVLRIGIVLRVADLNR
jgi:hypothetical protein